MQTSMIQVQEYFKCHLQRRNWQQLDSETQTAAVNTAETDIMLALGTEKLDISDLFSVRYANRLFIWQCKQNKTHLTAQAE